MLKVKTCRNLEESKHMGAKEALTQLQAYVHLSNIWAQQRKSCDYAMID